MSWYRQEASFFQNPNVMLAGWDGAVVFLVCCHMAKTLDWKDGLIEKRTFTPGVIRRFSGCPFSDTQIEDALNSCVSAGLLQEDATHYFIRNWAKFQPDPTALARKRKQRGIVTDEPDVTERHRDNRDVTLQNRTGQDRTDVTRQTDDARDRADGVLSDAASRGGDGAGGSRGGGLHKGQRLSPTAWASVDAILDGLCRGEQGEVEQQRALQLRRLRKAGALGDEIGAELLDRWKSKYAKSIGKAKLSARQNGAAAGGGR